MNLKHLKKERDKLVAQIEKSRQDLAALDRVIRMFGEKEGNGGDAGNGASVEATAPVVGTEPTGTPGAEPGDAEEASSGWLKQLVTNAVAVMSGEFTKSEVFDKMVELNPENKERIRADVVSAVVWRMANRTNELETVVKGKGSKASVYRKRV